MLSTKNESRSLFECQSTLRRLQDHDWNDTLSVVLYLKFNDLLMFYNRPLEVKSFYLVVRTEESLAPKTLPCKEYATAGHDVLNRECNFIRAWR